jgi:hypothetical protein
MPGKSIVLTKTLPSIAEAEEFLARLWACLERHNLETPPLRLSFRHGVTIIAEFRDAATAKLVASDVEDAAA